MKTDTIPPKWLWEGIAMALSEQLKFGTDNKYAKMRLRKDEVYNICSKNIEKIHPYLEAGPLIMYYESKHIGFSKKLLYFFKKDNSLMNLKFFMKEKKLKCSVSSKEILKILSI